ncbi:MAG: hypothetical protein JRI38_02745 [Deltaproteobacteria bacterium]|nr:hypothetical protein [Deltaproteobacteria bacterium]
MVPVIKSAMIVISGLESEEQNRYAFQSSLGELNELKKIRWISKFYFEIKWGKLNAGELNSHNITKLAT